MSEGGPQKQATGGTINAPGEEDVGIQELQEEGEEGRVCKDQSPPCGMPSLRQLPRVTRVIETVAQIAWLACVMGVVSGQV